MTSEKSVFVCILLLSLFPFLNLFYSKNRNVAFNLVDNVCTACHFKSTRDSCNINLVVGTKLELVDRCWRHLSSLFVNIFYIRRLYVESAPYGTASQAFRIISH